MRASVEVDISRLDPVRCTGETVAFGPTFAPFNLRFPQEPGLAEVVTQAILAYRRRRAGAEIAEDDAVAEHGPIAREVADLARQDMRALAGALVGVSDAMARVAAIYRDHGLPTPEPFPGEDWSEVHGAVDGWREAVMRPLVAAAMADVERMAARAEAMAEAAE